LFEPVWSQNAKSKNKTENKIEKFRTKKGEGQPTWAVPVSGAQAELLPNPAQPPPAAPSLSLWFSSFSFLLLPS
jgi:hypothetical protein